MTTTTGPREDFLAEANAALGRGNVLEAVKVCDSTGRSA